MLALGFAPVEKAEYSIKNGIRNTLYAPFLYQYRRDDSGGHAGRLYDRLRGALWSRERLYGHRPMS